MVFVIFKKNDTRSQRCLEYTLVPEKELQGQILIVGIQKKNPLDYCFSHIILQWKN